MDRSYDVMTFISIHFYSKKAKVANFVDVIKTAIIFIKTTFEDLKKYKRFTSYVLKMHSISAFLDIIKVADFKRKNAGCVT